MDSRVPAQIDLLKKVDEGQLDELPCPQCRFTTVSVRFTQPTPDSYRTLLICSNCNFHFGAQIPINLRSYPRTASEKLHCKNYFST